MLSCFILKLDHEKINVFLQQLFPKSNPSAIFPAKCTHREDIKDKGHFSILGTSLVWMFQNNIHYSRLEQSHQAPNWHLSNSQAGTISCTRYRRRQIFNGVQYVNFYFASIWLCEYNIKFYNEKEDFKCLRKSSFISFSLVILVGSLTHRKPANTQEKH